MAGINNNYLKKITVDTNGSCFLCLKHCRRISGEEENKIKSDCFELYSLESVCRYLKVNINKLVNCSKKWVLEEFVDVKVELCGECGKSVEMFTEMYLEWEKLQLGLDELMKTVNGRMTEAYQHLEGLQSVSQLMGRDKNAVIQVDFGDKLRKEVAEKSGTFQKSPQVQVKLSRVQAIQATLLPPSIFVAVPTPSPPGSPTSPGNHKEEVKEEVNDEVEESCEHDYFEEDHNDASSLSSSPEDCNSLEEVSSIDISEIVASISSKVERKKPSQSQQLSFVSRPKRQVVTNKKAIKSKPVRKLRSNKSEVEEISSSEASSDNDNDEEYIPEAIKKSLLSNDNQPQREIIRKKQSLAGIYDYIKETKAYRCIHCRRNFKWPRKAREHFNVEHCSLKKCQYCLQSDFPSVEELQTHLEVCPKAPLKDPYFTQALISSKLLESTQFNESTGEYSCKICQNILKTRFSAWTHHRDNHLIFKCDICKIKSFKKPRHLKLHQKTCQSHLDRRKGSRHLCSLCGGKYSSQRALEDHVAHVHLKQKRSYKEKPPGGSSSHKFPPLRTLTLGDETLFECSKCTLVFKSKNLAYIHYDETHQDDVFTCNFCSLTFKSFVRLRHHRNSNCKKNPKYRRKLCATCGKDFAFVSNLKRHIKRVHS